MRQWTGLVGLQGCACTNGENTSCHIRTIHYNDQLMIGAYLMSEIINRAPSNQRFSETCGDTF